MSYVLYGSKGSGSWRPRSEWFERHAPRLASIAAKVGSGEARREIRAVWERHWG